MCQIGPHVHIDAWKNDSVLWLCNQVLRWRNKAKLQKSRSTTGKRDGMFSFTFTIVIMFVPKYYFHFLLSPVIQIDGYFGVYNACWCWLEGPQIRFWSSPHPAFGWRCLKEACRWCAYLWVQQMLAGPKSAIDCV